MRLNRRVTGVPFVGCEREMDRTITTSARQMSQKGAQKQLPSMAHFTLRLTVHDSMSSRRTHETYMERCSCTPSLRLNCSVIPFSKTSFRYCGSGAVRTEKSRSALISASLAEGERERKFLSFILRQHGRQYTLWSVRCSSKILLVQPCSASPIIYTSTPLPKLPRTIMPHNLPSWIFNQSGDRRLLANGLRFQNGLLHFTTFTNRSRQRRVRAQLRGIGVCDRQDGREGCFN